MSGRSVPAVAADHIDGFTDFKHIHARQASEPLPQYSSAKQRGAKPRQWIGVDGLPLADPPN
jgi:hypothetical protein